MQRGGHASRYTGEGAQRLAYAISKSGETMQLQSMMKRGAVVLGMGGLAVGASACGGSPRKQGTPFEEIARAANDATRDDEAASKMVELAKAGPKPRHGYDAARIILASGEATRRDKHALEAARIGMESRFSGQSFGRIADAANEATRDDSEMLDLLRVADRSMVPSAEIVSTFRAAGEATRTDDAAIAMAKSNLPSRQATPTPPNGDKQVREQKRNPKLEPALQKAHQEADVQKFLSSVGYDDEGLASSVIDHGVDPSEFKRATKTLIDAGDMHPTEAAYEAFERLVPDG